MERIPSTLHPREVTMTMAGGRLAVSDVVQIKGVNNLRNAHLSALHPCMCFPTAHHASCSNSCDAKTDAFKAECLAGLDAALKPRDSAARSESVAGTIFATCFRPTLSCRVQRKKESMHVSVPTFPKRFFQRSRSGIPLCNDGGPSSAVPGELQSCWNRLGVVDHMKRDLKFCQAPHQLFYYRLHHYANVFCADRPPTHVDNTTYHIYNALIPCLPRL